MKTPSDDLFLLIKSLSKTEKRYFKIYVSKNTFHDDSKYIKIFDLIDRQKVYDEEALKQWNVPFLKNIKKVKWRLTRIILRSLDVFYSESLFDSLIKNQFKNIYVLYRKGLYNQFMKSVIRLKKQALFYERYSEVIELCRLERRTPVRRSVSAEEIHALERMAVDNLANEIELQNLSDKVYEALEVNERVRDTDNTRKIKRILRHPLLNTEVVSASFRARYYYYNARGFCYSAIGEQEECYKCRKKQIKFIEKNAHQTKQYPELYISAINNFMISCFQTGRIREYYRYLKRLKNMEGQFNRDGNKRLATSIFSVTASLEAGTMQHLGNFNQVNRLIPELEEKLRYYGSGVNINVKLAVYYSVAYCLFGIGNYSMALLWVNKIIDYPKVEVRQDTQVFARILRLVIHYEMDNSELLDYINRSAFRFLRKRHRLYKSESYVLKFLKKVCVKQDKSEHIALFKILKKQLLTLSNDPSEKFASEEFDFISWLDSKIEDRSFSEVVKKKAAAVHR